MKRFMMQMMRTMVTVIVVGTMAMMIFSLRAELTEAKAKLATLGSRLPNSHCASGAQAAIVVCGSLDNGLPGRGREYWIHDCSAAAMNILLAAKGLGLGAVWTGVYPGEERIAIVREVLAIPEGYAPLNVIPLGYPAENPTPKDKWNASKVHYDTW